MTAFVAALLIKLTLVLTVGLVISAISRGLGPSVRHLILYAALVISALLPVAMWMSPSWNVPVLSRAFSVVLSSASDPGLAAASQRSKTVSGPVGFVDGDATPTSGILATKPTDAAAAQSSAPAADNVTPLLAATRAALGVLPLLPLLWAIGFAAVIAWLIIGHVGLRRIAARSWPLDSEYWNRILEEERAYAHKLGDQHTADVGSARSRCSFARRRTRMARGTRPNRFAARARPRRAR